MVKNKRLAEMIISALLSINGLSLVISSQTGPVENNELINEQVKQEESRPKCGFIAYNVIYCFTHRLRLLAVSIVMI